MGHLHMYCSTKPLYNGIQNYTVSMLAITLILRVVSKGTTFKNLNQTHEAAGFPERTELLIKNC